MPDDPRILLIRTSALGDVVHCLPVLTALRRRCPEARIGWVVEEAMAPVLEDHPDLDELVVVGLRPWRKNPWASRRDMLATWRRMRDFRPDVALDLMGNHKGGALAWLSGAPRRLGLAPAFRREAGSGLYVNETVEPTGPHAVDRALSVARPLGISAEEADFGGDKLFPAVPDLPAEALPSGPFAVVQPGAGWGNKIYPPARWGRVARGLADEPGLPTVVPIAPGEEGLAREVAEASDGAARTVPAFGLAALAALLRQARLVLGGDTGPTHLAHALGTPTLCVLGPTDPERHGLHGAPDRSLAVRLPCSFCYKRFDATKACLLSLPPERILDAARRLFDACTRASTLTDFPSHC